MMQNILSEDVKCASRVSLGGNDRILNDRRLHVLIPNFPDFSSYGTFYQTFHTCEFGEGDFRVSLLTVLYTPAMYTLEKQKKKVVPATTLRLGRSRSEIANFRRALFPSLFLYQEAFLHLSDGWL